MFLTQEIKAAGYRFPDKCCGNCTHAYQNGYGDYQCTLFCGATICLGGICDKFHAEVSDESSN